MNSRGNHNNNRDKSSGRAGPVGTGKPREHQQAQNSNGPVLAPKDQADLDIFRASLKELTFNSRPIIEKLTVMAGERAKTISGPVSRTILDNLVFVSNFKN